jgi:hypothetical protein
MLPEPALLLSIDHPDGIRTKRVDTGGHLAELFAYVSHVGCVLWTPDADCAHDGTRDRTDRLGAGARVVRSGKEGGAVARRSDGGVMRRVRTGRYRQERRNL